MAFNVFSVTVIFSGISPVFAKELLCMVLLLQCVFHLEICFFVLVCSHIFIYTLLTGFLTLTLLTWNMG